MLIKPLKPELIEKYRDYDEANGILTLTKEAGDIYYSITQINGDFSTNIEGQIGTLNSMIEKLDQIEGELKIKYPS